MKNPSHETSDDPVKANRDMFINIYNTYRQSIFNYVYYRVGDSALADDITSDVFVRVVDKYDGRIEDHKKIAPWLYTIARNLLIDHYRRAEKREVSTSLDHHHAGESSNPVRQTDRKLTQECLMKGLGHLTEDQQQVIILKFVDRFSNQEVGDRLGKSEGAIKSLQYRALAALRRVLEKEPCYEA